MPHRRKALAWCLLDSDTFIIKETAASYCRGTLKVMPH